MKRTLLPFFAVALLALGSTAAFAQVDVTVTGSTAFRAITIDRAYALFDPASRVSQTNNASIGLITMTGTMSNAAPSLGGTSVKLRLSFSGSEQGMQDVRNQTPISTAALPGEAAPGVSNITKIPDLALSDVFPSSATPPIPESAFNRAVVGTVPILFVKNKALTGVTNITQAQANLLMVASGTGGMPASFLGGNNNNPVYFIGRDSGSGTRITAEKCTGFVGSPLMWATNVGGAYIVTNGFSSGGLVRGVVNAKSDAIGIMSYSDYAAISNNAAILPFNGIAFSHTNVTVGQYSIWGYQHLVNKVGLSGTKATVRDALISAISNPGFQGTNTLYNVGFTAFSEMHVERGSDGGTITSLDF